MDEKRPLRRKDKDNPYTMIVKDGKYFRYLRIHSDSKTIAWPQKNRPWFVVILTKIGDDFLVKQKKLKKSKNFFWKRVEILPLSEETSGWVKKYPSCSLKIKYQHTGYVLSVVCSRGRANWSDLTPQGTAATAMTDREDNDTSVQSQSKAMRTARENHRTGRLFHQL